MHRNLLYRLRSGLPVPAETIAAATAAAVGEGLELGPQYLAAVLRWFAAGCPTRTPAEVERIFRECCEPCRRFDGSTCRECGCRVSPAGPALANKLKMDTEDCRLGKFSAIARR